MYEKITFPFDDGDHVRHAIVGPDDSRRRWYDIYNYIAQSSDVYVLWKFVYGISLSRKFLAAGADNKYQLLCFVGPI